MNPDQVFTLAWKTAGAQSGSARMDFSCRAHGAGRCTVSGICTKTGQSRTARERKAIRTAGWQVVLAAVVLVVGAGTTAWVARWQAGQEYVRVEREFQQAADKLFGRTLREIQLFMEVLDSIRQLHTLSDQVSAEAFEEIVRKGMIYQRRILGAYGFAQGIPHDMRTTYEQAGGADMPSSGPTTGVVSKR